MKTVMFTLFIGLMFLSSCHVKNVKEPEYRDIREVHLIELGVLQSTAGVDLVYYNPNNFGIQVIEARGDVYVDNQFLGRFGLNESVQVNKRSEFVLPAILRLDMIGAIKNQRELIKKKEVLLRIEGLARIKKVGITRDVPIRYESMQNIERLRSLIAK
ncbi:MAG: type 2 family protein [Ferruginibacter sp.]|nr:type 2 family protein [Ferruginibacter sp.]